MLKIKDNVDLKELEKFNISGYSNFCQHKLISVERAENSYILVREDTLFDLIQAGLIEKGEE